jgi:hypothetical protein
MIEIQEFVNQHNQLDVYEEIDNVYNINLEEQPLRDQLNHILTKKRHQLFNSLSSTKQYNQENIDDLELVFELEKQNVQSNTIHLTTHDLDILVELTSQQIDELKTLINSSSNLTDITTLSNYLSLTSTLMETLLLAD